MKVFWKKYLIYLGCIVFPFTSEGSLVALRDYLLKDKIAEKQEADKFFRACRLGNIVTPLLFWESDF